MKKILILITITLTCLLSGCINSERTPYYVDITFDANGATGTMDTVTVEAWETYTPKLEFTHPTKIFYGWAESSNPLNSEIYTDWYVPTEDVTLYAIWKDAFEFSLIGSTYELSKYYDNKEVVEIPSTYNGVDVTSIGASAFYFNTNIKSVIIPDTVTIIKANAFQFASSLTSVTLPSSVKTIKTNAFHTCALLVDIDLTNVEVIESSAFNSCLFLEKVELTNVNVIEEGVFNGCTKLKYVTLSNSLTEIKEDAFRNCIQISNITIPLTVTKIDEDAFENCKLTFDVKASEEQPGWQTGWNQGNVVIYSSSK